MQHLTCPQYSNQPPRNSDLPSPRGAPVSFSSLCISDLLSKTGSLQLLGLRVHQISHHYLFFHLSVEDVFAIYHRPTSRVTALAPTNHLKAGSDHTPKKIISGRRNQLISFDYSSRVLTFVGVNCKPHFKSSLPSAGARESISMSLLPSSNIFVLSHVSDHTLHIDLFNCKSLKPLRQYRVLILEDGEAGGEMDRIYKTSIVGVYGGKVMVYIGIVMNYRMEKSVVCVYDVKRGKGRIEEVGAGEKGVVRNSVRCGMFTVGREDGEDREVMVCCGEGRVRKVKGDMVQAIAGDGVGWIEKERKVVVVLPVAKGRGGFIVREGRIDEDYTAHQEKEWALEGNEVSGEMTKEGEGEEDEWHGFWSFCQNYNRMYYWPFRSKLYEIKINGNDINCIK